MPKIPMLYGSVETLDININDQNLHIMLIMQATLPKNISVEGGTFKPYMRGVYMAYAFVCYCYFTVAICGYWAFGQAVEDNVLLSIRHPKWVVAVADMFVVVHVFGSYQVSNTTAAHAQIGVWLSGLWQSLDMYVMTHDSGSCKVRNSNEHYCTHAGLSWSNWVVAVAGVFAVVHELGSCQMNMLPRQQLYRWLTDIWLCVALATTDLLVAAQHLQMDCVAHA